MDHVSYRYGRRGDGINDVDLDVRRGQTVALMGANGSGKTTVLRVAAGLLRPASGQVFVRTNGHEETVRGPSPKIGYIPQNLGLLRARTVLQNVLLGGLARVRGWRSMLALYPASEAQRALDAIERVGLSAKTHARVHQLSGGERQRVAIARTLVQHPTILIADEFVGNLDPIRQREILELVRDKLHEEHQATIMAVHNLELARRFADRIVFVRAGRLVADLPAAQVTQEVAESHLAS